MGATIEICNANVVFPDRVERVDRLQFRQGRIVAIGEWNEHPADRHDLDGHYLLPGFVELHVHGGGGADFMDLTPDAFRTVCRTHANHGTTSMTPTSTVASEKDTAKFLELCRSFRGQSTSGSRIVGAHHYGPYFSPEARGCHPTTGFQSPDASHVDAFAGFDDSFPLTVTIAPELPNAEALTRACCERGIRVNVGHSYATMEQVEAAIGWGARHVDHLFCAMSDRARLRQKQTFPMRAGVLEATLYHDELTTEVIADGKHLNNSLLRLAYKIKGPDKLALVTDSMRAVDLPDGEYWFGPEGRGERIRRQNDVGVTLDGQALASGVMGLDHCVRTMLNATGAPLHDVVRMASLTPARILGLNREIGSIGVGKRADFVVMNSNLQVQQVFLDGTQHQHDSMELADFEQLLTPRGQELLAAAMELQPNERTFLAAYEKIRKRCDPELAKAAVETAILRAKAAAKFPNAAAMYFTREALEQSSSAAVAGYRATRYKQYGCVADLCCGIGGDALAFAAAGCRVVAIERDPLRARMAEANLAACGFARQSQVIADDVLELPMPPCDAAFCDPSRRADGRRFLSPADYQPPPNAVLDHFPTGFPVAFKLAPGVPLEDLDEYEAEAEFLSLDGELKECILWFGPDRKAFRRATVLPTGDTFSALSEEPLPEFVPPMRYVYDPDPALARSGLVGNWADSLNLKSLDERVAVLTSESAFHSPFATVYEVEETIPFHAKRLTEYLRARNIGRVTPVKRGSTVDTEALLRQLKLRGDEHRTILFTRTSGQQVAIVANRIDALAAI